MSVTGSDLRSALLKLEHPEGLCFVETASLDELVAELRLYDVAYRGVFLWFVPMKAYDIYRMRLRIDQNIGAVLLQDERESYLKSWTKVRHDHFKGVYKLARETDTLWGRRGDGSLGTVYRYSFDSEALKNPVRELVAEHGWALRETKFS